MSDDKTYTIARDESHDYDAMSCLSFVNLIRTEIAPSDMAIFADIVNSKVDEFHEVLKNCNACSMQKREMMEAFRRFSEYALKLALLVNEASVWMAVEIETKEKLFGR